MRPGGLRDYWTLLHPPYTLWHLSLVVLGACVAPGQLDLGRLGLALAAFFLAVGIAAHALDEFSGRPLQTTIPSKALISLAALSLAGAGAIGLYGASLVSWWGLLFIAIGGFIVPAYNLEWFHGAFHSDLWFALMWGAFPALAGSFAQAGRFTVATVLVAIGCGLLAAAQRTLSTPVRALRRRTTSVSGTITRTDGSTESISLDSMRRVPEAALRVLSLAVITLATGLLAARWP